jgi:phosphate transporter family protein
MDLSLIVVVVIVTALAFDFTNGFHDTANAMATSIATKALKPRTGGDHRRPPQPDRRVPLGRGRQDHPNGDLRRVGRRDLAVILTSSHLGFALSTTQVATGSIFEAGAGRRLASVQWSVAGQMAVAWLLTLPAAAVVGAVAAWPAGTGIVGTIIVALVLVGLSAGIYAASRRRPVDADNVNDVPAPKSVAAAA